MEHTNCPPSHPAAAYTNLLTAQRALGRHVPGSDEWLAAATTAQHAWDALAEVAESSRARSGSAPASRHPDRRPA
jgi:hypothetical protein